MTTQVVDEEVSLAEDAVSEENSTTVEGTNEDTNTDINEYSKGTIESNSDQKNYSYTR